MAVGDRTVAVRLLAEVSGYVSGMNQAALSAWRVERQTQKAGAGASKSMDGAAKSANRLGNIFMGLGGIVAVGIGAKALGALLDFEDAMARVAAASGATGNELGKMRDAALDAGRDTIFTASEAADAMTELAKAGVSSADILGGALTGALDLAAAGQVDVAFAAETAATAMVQFNLAGSDMAHIADLLAAGAGKAQGDVDDLALALRQGGQVASMVGWSFEDTTAALTSFAAAGLLSSDAGTSLKTMLLRLANPSNEAADVMRDLGLSAYDAQGNFLTAAALAGELTQAFSGLEPEARNAAMGVIFGTDAVRAANVLYAEGESGIENWTRQVNDSGYAAEVAAKKSDTLRGDLNRLGGTLSALVNENGSGLNTMLREMVQLLDELVKGGPWEVTIRENVEERDRVQRGQPNPDDYVPNSRIGPARPSNMNLWDAIQIGSPTKGFYKPSALNSLPAWNMSKNLESFVAAQEAGALDTATLMMSMGGLADEMDRAGRFSSVAADGIGDIEGAAEDAQIEVDLLREAILNLGAVEIGKDAAVDALTTAAQRARAPFDDLAEAQKEVAEAQADLNAAETDAERESRGAALARAKENLALAEAAITLEGNSAAAIENRENLRDLATQAAETAAAFVDGSVEGAAAADEQMRIARDAFIQTATDMGMPIEQAEVLADKYGLIPTMVPTIIETTDNASERIAAIKAQLDALPRDKWVTISVTTNYTETGLQNKLASSMMPSFNADGGFIRRAGGGTVPGYGAGRSDSVRALLTPGEFVSNTHAAAMFGPLLQSMNALGTAVATMPGGINFTGDINVRDGRDLISQARLQRLVYG